MRHFLRSCFAALTIAAVAAPCVAATDYPTRPIRLVVPYPAGGATDVVARIVATKMSDILGQQVVVDNRPGAGTMIGASAVARSDPDGYMILMGDTGTYALNPTLYGSRLTYDPVKDLAPVARIGRVPLILAANPKTVTANSVKDLIEAAKKEPGKLDYGAPGPGSPIHLAMELFKQRVGIKMTAIPYKGGADALTDLIAGRVGLLFIDAATGATNIKSGTLKGLGIATTKRISALPDLPTIAEASVADFEASAWNGLAVPTGTPPEIIAKLNSAATKALATPEVQSRFAELSVQPFPGGAQEFGAFIKSEGEKWKKVITEAGVSLQ